MPKLIQEALSERKIGNARKAEFICKLPSKVTIEVLKKLNTLIKIKDN